MAMADANNGTLTNRRDPALPCCCRRRRGIAVRGLEASEVGKDRSKGGTIVSTTLQLISHARRAELETSVLIVGDLLYIC